MLVAFFDRITRLSLRFRWMTILLAAAILAAGISAMLGLNLELLPRIEFPQTFVVAQWSETESPQQFLEQVTVPLEEKLSAVDGVVNVESTTNSGFAFIIVRNEFGLDQERVLADIKTAVTTADLPPGMETPQVLNFSLSDLPVVVASVSSSQLTLAELKDIVQTDLQPRLENLDQVSRVAVSGGQELPDETAVAENDTTTTAEPEDPGRLPPLVVEGAKALGLDIEYAQDVTPELLSGLGGTGEQVLAALRLIPPDVLPYAPPETLLLLPAEYVQTLDAAVVARLEEQVAGMGSIGQYSLGEVVALLAVENGTETAAAEPETAAAEAPPEPAETPVAETGVTEPPQVEPVDLPDSWKEAGKAAGFALNTTADVSSAVMAGLLNFGPQLLGDLEPPMWRALDPEATALALPEVADEMDSALLAQLQAIQLAAVGEAAEPVALPDSWIAAAGAAGFTLETTADVPAEVLGQMSSFAPQLLDDLTEEMILAFAPDVQAALSSEYVASLDEGLQQTLANIAVHAARYATAAGSSAAGVPQMMPVPLPEMWISGATALGQTITDTSDITAEGMEGIISFAPEQLDLLTPEMWRAFDPAATAVVLPQVAETMDAGLLAQLQAIQLAANGAVPEPVALPDSWIAAAAGAGFTLETTADVTAEAMAALSNFAPQLLDDLSEEMLLAMSPDTLAALPDSFVAGLDEGLQQTLTNVQVAAAQFTAAQVVAENGEPAAEEPAVDPARLPDLLIQGAKATGLEIEFAQDIEPDFVRTMSALGEQGIQALSMLTPDNLRLLQPEVIALLPAAFLDTLDPALRQELDDLAAEYGGAGQLAAAEAEAAAAAAADAPPLSGIWLEPGPNGEEPLFKNAADLLNNPFADNAAALLNRIPENAQEPVRLMGDLTPEVMQYLAEHEADFVQNLSPIILEWMSPETLIFLLDNYPDAFPSDLAESLRGIATGNVTVFVPEASITRTDGDPSVIVSLFKGGDANTVEVAHRVFDALAAYESEHPELDTNLVFEQATFIEDSINGVTREGALGAVFAVIVILFFLSGRIGGKYKLSWRATVVTSVSIPLSVFTAFFLMRWLPVTFGSWLQSASESSGSSVLLFIARLFPTNISLNIMTLSGMTVAIGRVVDDSIVVLENVYRFIQQGDDPREAVIEGTKEVAIAIFSATATTVAVFLPLSLIGGVIGSFFLPFGLTVTYALLASFIVSITVVPALAYLLIRREHIPDKRETTMQRWYTPILEWALAHRGYTMAIATFIFLSSLFLLTRLPQSFIPSLGEPTINVAVNLPIGTKMAETDALAQEFEAKLRSLEGIERIQTEIGSAGGVEAIFGGGSISQNLANLTITVNDQEELTRLNNEVREAAESVFGADRARVSAAARSGFGGFALVLAGDSLDELRAVADEVKSAIASVDVDGDGVADIANVSSSVDNAGVSGGEDTIIRIDGRPAITFSGEIESDNTLGVTSEAKQAVISTGLPADVQVTEGFDTEQQTQGFRSMFTAILYSIVIVYLIMALTFRSLIHPFTILFSLPFALVGASLALIITNSVLGISAMIGLMMLVGIVVTNGIVLMELVQQLRQRGKNAYDALVQGGRTRLRPIWMTALAAILALIPLAASSEAGAIIASELARAVIGGLLVSTLLTLVVVPVVYSLFDDAALFFRRKLRRERVK